jgi:hypothetical protein
LIVPARIGTTPIYLRLRLPEGQRIKDFKVGGHARATLEAGGLVLRELKGKETLRIRIDTAARSLSPP